MQRDSAADGPTRRGDVWPVLLAGLAPVLIVLIWGSLRSPQNAYDDAFITYRYADNLRRGAGLVYNPGEWVLGTTTPLYALLLAALSRIGGAVEWWGHWVSVLGWIVCSLAVLGQLWQDRRRAAGVLASLLIAVIPLMAPALGMETGFYLALLWLAAWAWMRDRHVLAALLSALAILTRQDAVLFVGLLFIARSAALHRVLWRAVLVMAVLVAPWFSYAFWRYGSVLPNSALAKINQNALMQVQGSASFPEQFLSSLTNNSPFVAAGLAVAALAGLYVIARWARAWWWAPFWVSAYVGAYTLLNVHPFPWYFLPPITGVLTVCAIGLGAALDDRPAIANRTLRSASTLAAVACTAIVLALNGKSVMALSVANQPGHRPEYWEVGSWLAANTKPTDRIATIEIGVIGYRSGRPILDTMGLVSPQMRGHLVGWLQTLVYALEQRPEYAVALSQSGWGMLVDQWWFRQQYEPVARFGSADIYERKPDLALSYRVGSKVDYAAGFSITELEASDRILTPGQPLTMTLDVRVERAIGLDCNLITFFANTATYERSALQGEMPYTGGYGCASWQPGDELRVPLRITPPGQMQPGAYQLGVEFAQTQTGEYFYLASDPAARTVLLGWFRLGNPESRTVDGRRTPVDAEWENGIKLIAVTAPPESVAADAPRPVGFEWEAGATSERDLTVFVHLLDAAGNIVAQSDRRPFEGRFPTTVWRPGERLQDVYMLQAPEPLSPGEYSLRIGFYDAAGRLPLARGGAESLVLDGAVIVP